jgi:hypothetical protein
MMQIYKQKKTYFCILIAILFSQMVVAKAHDNREKFWPGHMIHGSVGFIADQIQHTKPQASKIIIRGNPSFFYGYDYGWQFAKDWYWSLGLEWTIAYPRNFLTSSTTSKLVASWIQPLTHVRIGYVFQNDALLTLGLTYLWALSANFRVPLGDHLFVEAQYLQWLDGVFNIWQAAPTLGAAFDFANFSWGLGWKF